MIYYDRNEEHPSIARISKLRENMAESFLDWVIIYTADPHLSEYVQDTDKARFYFSGFSGSYGVLLLSMTEAYLWTDSRYYVQAEAELMGSNITLMCQGQEGVVSVEEYISAHVWNGERIGIDFRTSSISSYLSLKDKLPSDVELVDCVKVISKSFEDRPKRVFNEVILLDDEICGAPSSEKIEGIRQLINKKMALGEETYTYIISDLTSIMWILNMRGNDIEYVPVAYAYLTIDAYVTTLYINKKALTNEIKEKLTEKGIRINEYGNFYNELESIATDYILLDEDRNNAAIYNKVIEYCQVKKIKDYKFIRKYIKNDAEIEGIKNAHLTDAIVMIDFIRKIKDKVKNGEKINEYQAGKMLDDMRLDNNACLDLSFETICAYKENGAIVHYSADEDNCKQLSAEGFLLIDSGGQYEMGTTDVTRTILLGKASEEEKRVYTSVLKGNLRLMNQIFKKGIRGDNLDIVARSPIWDMGYDYGHGTGHGIGARLSVHEAPVSISYRARTDVALEAGILVSDEPGVYLEDKFGVRLENALLVRENVNKPGFLEFESMTLVPFEREAIDINLLDEKEINFLNDYHAYIYEQLSHLLQGDALLWLKENTTKFS